MMVVAGAGMRAAGRLRRRRVLRRRGELPRSLCSAAALAASAAATGGARPPAAVAPAAALAGVFDAAAGLAPASRWACPRLCGRFDLGLTRRGLGFGLRALLLLALPLALALRPLALLALVSAFVFGLVFLVAGLVLRRGRGLGRGGAFRRGGAPESATARAGRQRRRIAQGVRPNSASQRTLLPRAARIMRLLAPIAIPLIRLMKAKIPRKRGHSWADHQWPANAVHVTRPRALSSTETEPIFFCYICSHAAPAGAAATTESRNAMTAKTRFRGSFTALVTPFKNGSRGREGVPRTGGLADRRRHQRPRSGRHHRRKPDALPQGARAGGRMVRRPGQGPGAGGRGRRLELDRRGGQPVEARREGRRRRRAGGHALLQQADAGGALPALQGDQRRDRHSDHHVQHSRPARSSTSTSTP